MASRGISLNKVLRWECCAPTCTRKPLEDLEALPLCPKHARLVFDYFDGFAHIAQQVIQSRHPVDPEEVKAQVLAANEAIRRERHISDEFSQVYYAEVNGRIKIGHTVNIKQRFNAMRIPLDRLLATEPGGRDLEAVRHAQFASIRHGRLEEFERTDDLLSHIAMIRDHYGEPKVTTWGGRVA